MKLRTPAYIFIPLTLLAILIPFIMILPSEYPSQTGFGGWMANLYHGVLTAFSNFYFWGVILISLVMLFIVDVLNKMVECRKFEKLTEEQQARYLEARKRGYLKNLWASSREKQTEEEEQSIILDHGFDGITELDNALPQWWLSLFYFGIIFMVVYVLAFSFTDFANTTVEYEEETEFKENQFATWIKANDIDITGAVNKSDDEAILEEGKQIFLNNCATCHTANGGGAAGPNLTDDYWINQMEDSLFYNVYNVVYNGAPNNPAMQAWSKDLTGLDIEKVASYVYHMNQNLPDVTKDMGGKDPEGELPVWYQGDLQNKSNQEPETPSDSVALSQEKPADDKIAMR